MEIIGELNNFFDNPDMVREVALLQKYDQCNFNGPLIYSGLRSSEINKDSPIYVELKSKVQQVIKFNLVNFTCNFHINPENSCLGFPHTDTLLSSQTCVSGVVYLNKEYPSDCGTTLFYPSESYNSLNDKEYLSKMQVAYSTHIPIKNTLKREIVEECIHFKNKVLKKMKQFQFEYNKLVYYDGSILHSPDFYFGNNISNSRLTVVFHSKISK